MASAAAATVDRNAALMSAVGEVDLLDLAGRIIVNPERAKVSLAEQLALAMFAEALWATCLEAEAMVAALDAAADAAPEARPALRTKFIDHADEVKRRMAVLKGKQEKCDGSGHS